MAEFLSNGTVRLGPPVSALLRGATSVSFKGDSNSQDVQTLVGDVGSTEGIKMGTLSVQGAVAANSAERAKVVRAWQSNLTVQAYYTSGGVTFVVTGTIKNITNDDKVNSPTEFNFEITGKSEPAQGI